MSKFGLPEHCIDKINGVLANYPTIERAIIYGSRAKGNYKRGSDIDLTLIGADLDTATLFKLMDDLDDLLLPWMFDLSLFHQIDHADLREHIQRVGQVFYSRTSD